MDLTFAADPLAPLRDLYRRAYLASLQRGAGREGVNAFQAAWRDELSRLAPVDPGKLERVMSEERRRVDEARVVAELLLPELLNRTPASLADVHEPASASYRAAPRPAPEGSTAVADSSGAATPAVADLLDAMLRQDSARSKRLTTSA